MVRNGALVSRLRERHPLLELNVQIRRTSNHEMREVLFHVHGIEVNAVVETNNDLLLRSLIADGVGMGMVREDFAGERRKDRARFQEQARRTRRSFFTERCASARSSSANFSVAGDGVLPLRR